MFPPTTDPADKLKADALDRWVQRQKEEAMSYLPFDLEVVPSPLLLEMELAPAGPGSGCDVVDLFTFLSREAEKTLRRSAGLSVPKSAYDGSRLATPCPGTGPLRRRSSSPPIHTAMKPSPSSFLWLAAASSPASSPATALSARLPAPPMPSSLAPAHSTESSPDELEERLRFYARQIKSFRTTSIMYSSPVLMERIRQMERDYETAVRQFYCRPPPPTSGPQSAAAEQPTSGPQSAAAEQPTSGSQPDTPQPDTPQSGMTPDPKSASTASTRRRGRRKRDAPAQVIGGPGDASAHATEGLCNASVPAHATEGVCDASAPAHTTEGVCDASAPAHITEGPADASAPVPSLQGFSEELVLVLASEPCNEGFEEGAPPDPVSEGFKEQFVLVLVSEPSSKGSPGSASASEGLPGSTPPEFHRVSGGSSTLLGRPPDQPAGSRRRPPRSLRFCRPPRLCRRSPRLRRRPPRTLWCRSCRPPELGACSGRPHGRPPELGACLGRPHGRPPELGACSGRPHGRPPELCACSGRPPGRPPELCACSGRPPGRPPELCACSGRPPGRPPELCACSGRPPGRPPELCACAGRPPGRPPELSACSGRPPGRPPELCACSGRPPGRPPELCACSGRPPCRPPELCFCFWPSYRGPHRPLWSEAGGLMLGGVV
ncbi:hypothetical protein CRENBAI_010403 [Crenichthys baileyi]|uniref:Uncharacterized protein n=1 Tax=Crenichthys baileyi TaxID=28760 RepID=A0AAV9QUZ2_9TELE